MRELKWQEFVFSVSIPEPKQIIECSKRINHLEV